MSSDLPSPSPKPGGPSGIPPRNIPLRIDNKTPKSLNGRAWHSAASSMAANAHFNLRKLLFSSSLIEYNSVLTRGFSLYFLVPPGLNFRKLFLERLACLLTKRLAVSFHYELV